MTRIFDSLTILSAGVLLSVAGSAAALAGTIGGCADSPENPTLLLGLLAGAAAAAPWVRTRLKRRTRKLSS